MYCNYLNNVIIVQLAVLNDFMSTFNPNNKKQKRRFLVSDKALSEYFLGYFGSQLEVTCIYMTLSVLCEVIKLIKLPFVAPPRPKKTKRFVRRFLIFFVVFYTEVDAKPFNPSVQKFGRYDDNDDTLSKSLSILSNKDEDIPS